MPINTSDPTVFSTIIPESAESTYCAQFNFVTDPGQETKDAILNYCQNYFSNPGWYKNGCIICSTSTLSATVGGLKFPQNASCPVSAQSEVLNTTTNPIMSSSISHVVCPIPTSLCSTDAGPTNTYATQFSSFTNSISTNSLLRKAVNSPSASLDTSYPVVTITDSSTLDISKLTVEIGSRNRFGQFMMTASYPTPALCYWQISTINTAPSFSSIASCTDSSWCGVAELGPVSFIIKVVNEREFAFDTSYYVYFGCSNDVPYSTSTSSVVSIGNFLYRPKPILEITKLSASYLNFSIATLLSLVMLLSII
jgi:hypothetical protein